MAESCAYTLIVNTMLTVTVLTLHPDGAMQPALRRPNLLILTDWLQCHGAARQCNGARTAKPIPAYDY